MSCEWVDERHHHYIVYIICILWVQSIRAEQGPLIFSIYYQLRQPHMQHTKNNLLQAESMLHFYQQNNLVIIQRPKNIQPYSVFSKWGNMTQYKTGMSVQAWQGCKSCHLTMLRDKKKDHSVCVSHLLDEHCRAVGWHMDTQEHWGWAVSRVMKSLRSRPEFSHSETTDQFCWLTLWWLHKSFRVSSSNGIQTDKMIKIKY